jgi:HK97 family phage major capsid protein
MGTSVTAQGIIDAEYAMRPRVLYGMDRAMLRRVQRLRDDNGTYLWTPDPVYPEKPGQFCGYAIAVTEAPGPYLHLQWHFPTGEIVDIDLLGACPEASPKVFA